MMLIFPGEVNTLPNIKSAMKRVKVNEKKNLRNRMIKSAMKTQVKKFETALSAGEVDGKLLSATQGAIDKAVTKGVIHKNAANRKKARLPRPPRRRKPRSRAMKPAYIVGFVRFGGKETHPMAVSPPEVVLIGAAILDALAPGADACVFETGSLPCPGLRLQTGGDAMNEAVVLSKLGRRARLVSRLGRDSAGDLILGVCKRHGIDTSFVVRADIDTGVNIVLVSPDGERCFLTNPEGSLRNSSPRTSSPPLKRPVSRTSGPCASPACSPILCSCPRSRRSFGASRKRARSCWRT